MFCPKCNFLNINFLFHKNNITLARNKWDMVEIIYYWFDYWFCHSASDCDWTAVMSVLSRCMAWGKLTRTSCRWIADVQWPRCAIGCDPILSGVSYVCATKSSHQALLDSPQRLVLVFISIPPCLALHLLIRCLGALHCGKRRGIWIEISYFVLEHFLSQSVCSLTLFLPFFVISLAPLFLLLQRDVQLLCSPLLHLADFFLASLFHIFLLKKEKESALANTKAQKFCPGLL